MNTRAKYTGTALPADSDTEVLFSTTTMPMASFFQITGIRRVVFDIKNSHIGTIKVYKSDDRGTNWEQISEDSVAVPAATDTNTYDYLVEPYRDWKAEWVNGGTTQTKFEIDIALTDDRSPAA